VGDDGWRMARAGVDELAGVEIEHPSDSEARRQKVNERIVALRR
jgi:hypothetical protein